MAFGRRSKQGSTAGATAKPGRPHAAGETFLDARSELSGELRFAGDVCLEGRVEGQITAGGTVVVRESAEIDATITAETLVVFGTVVGDVRVRRRTTLHKSARVEGEIQTAGIVVEEGARFKGCIVIGPDEQVAEAVAPVRAIDGTGPSIGNTPA